MLILYPAFSKQRFHEFFSGSMELTLFLVVFNRDFMIAQYRLISLAWGQFSRLMFLIFSIFFIDKIHPIRFIPF
jgi:hypothetical protein